MMRSSYRRTLPTEGKLLTFIASVFMLGTLAQVEPCTQIVAPDSHADTRSRLLVLDHSGDTIARLFLLAQRLLTTCLASPGGAP